VVEAREASIVIAGIAIGAKYAVDVIVLIMGLMRGRKMNGNGYAKWEDVVRYFGSEKAVLEQRMSEGERSFARIEVALSRVTDMLEGIQATCSSRGERIAFLEARGK
jgi:hypothetical protein